MGVLEGGLLLGCDVLQLRAFPRVLRRAASAGQWRVGPGIAQGLSLKQPPLLLVQLGQDGNAGVGGKAWRIGGGHFSVVCTVRMIGNQV